MHGCRDGSKYRTYSHFAVAILAEQNAGFALLDNRKLLLCSVTSPRIVLFVLMPILCYTYAQIERRDIEHGM